MSEDDARMRTQMQESLAVWRRTALEVSTRETWPLPIAFHVDPAMYVDALEVRCSIQAADIETGKQTRIWQARMVPGNIYSELDRVDFLARLARDVVVHEIDECLLFRGRQIRNPHIAIGRQCPEHERCLVTATEYKQGQRYACSTVSDLRRST